MAKTKRDRIRAKLAEKGIPYTPAPKPHKRPGRDAKRQRQERAEARAGRAKLFVEAAAAGVPA